MLGYGIIYTLVHDGLVHQRWFRWVPKRGYARRLVQAHKLHHATIGKQGGVSFGFVFARDPAAGLSASLPRKARPGSRGCATANEAVAASPTRKRNAWFGWNINFAIDYCLSVVSG